MIVMSGVGRGCQVNDKWREQMLAAVADLKVVQVGFRVWQVTCRLGKFVDL
jgi:hypothetical protein